MPRPARHRPAAAAPASAARGGRRHLRVVPGSDAATPQAAAARDLDLSAWALPAAPDDVGGPPIVIPESAARARAAARAAARPARAPAAPAPPPRAPRPKAPRGEATPATGDGGPRGGPTPGRRRSAVEAGTAAERNLAAVVILLVSFGIVMVYSASSTTGLLAGTGRSSYLVRHVVYAALGLGAMLLLRRVPFRRWRAVASPLMLVALVLVAATVTMGAEVNGARRWLVLGPIQFGPAEPAKLAMICFLASRLTGRAAPVGSVGAILRTAWPAVLPLVGLVALQPDQGTATVIVLTAGALIITAGARWGHALGIGAFALGLAGAYAWSADYRRERLLAFLDPFRDAHDSGYQIVQSLMAIGSGGLHGVGLGESVQKVFFLPEAHTDMIFAIIGEELGLIGMLGVIGAFVALAMIGFGVSRRCRDPFGALLAAGITTWFCGQAFVNVGSVTGSLPLTGVPLPFVSFGGTSLIALMAATGILMNIAATGPRAERPVPSEAGRTLGR